MQLRSMFLASFMLASGVAVKAQFSKGDKMYGATVGTVVFSSGTADITVASIGSNSSKITNYNISLVPQMGWFVSDNTVAGVTLNINPNGQKTTYKQSGVTYESDKSNAYNIGLGGFARSYFNSKSSLLPFAQASINGGFSNLKTEGFFYGGSGPTAYKDSYTGNSTGGSFFNASFVAGFTKLVGESAGLDIYIGYNFAYTKNDFKRTTLRDIGNDGTVDTRSENQTTTKYTSNGFMLGVGFQIFSRAKKK